MCLYVLVETLVFFIWDDSLLLGPLLLLLLLANPFLVTGKHSLHGLDPCTSRTFAFPSSSKNPLFQQGTPDSSDSSGSFSQQQLV
jgi:hypothetical protein